MKRRNAWFVVLSLSASLLGLSASVGFAADKWAPGEAAVAAAKKYFMHLGISAVPYDESSTTTRAGNPVPGADIRLDPNYTVSTESGYFLTPNFAVAFSGGYPPTETSWGAGTTAALGALGKVTGGVMTLNGQYHVTDFGAFMPYVGAGAAYLLVFNTENGALSNFHVSNAFGFNFQIGADWMLSDRFGLFVDLKKVLITTSSRGNLGGDLVASTVRLDPTIYTVGLTVRY